MNRDIRGMCGECLEIVEVRGNGDAARFSHRYHDGVHGGPATGQTTQLGSAAGRDLWQVVDDLTGLKEPVCKCVTSSIALKALDQHDGGNDRRPKSFPLKDADSRDSLG